MLDAPRPNHTVSDATAEAGRLLGKLCEVFYSSEDESHAAPAIADRSPTGRRRIGNDADNRVANHRPPGERPRRDRARAGTGEPARRRRRRGEAGRGEPRSNRGLPGLGAPRVCPSTRVQVVRHAAEMHLMGRIGDADVRLARTGAGPRRPADASRGRHGWDRARRRGGRT